MINCDRSLSGERSQSAFSDKNLVSAAPADSSSAAVAVKYPGSAFALRAHAGDFYSMSRSTVNPFIVIRSSVYRRESAVIHKILFIQHIDLLIICFITTFIYT